MQQLLRHKRILCFRERVSQICASKEVVVLHVSSSLLSAQCSFCHFVFEGIMFYVNARELQFDDVAVNGPTSYRTFCLKNLMDYSIDVQLECSSTCVKFQLCNENFTDESLVSNVALFDEVNLISSVKVASGGETTVIASFCTDPTLFATVSQGMTCNGVITLCCSDQVERLPFTSRVFLSSMSVSPTELHCSLSPGKSHVMELCVTNGSAKDLPVVFRLASMPSRCVAIDVCAREFAMSCLGETFVLEPHEMRKFFVVVRSLATDTSPTTQCSATIQCDNLRDSRNTFHVQVSTTLSREAQGDLLVLGETFLSFGDVYRGASASKGLAISNISAVDATVKVMKPRSDECEVCFCIDGDVVEELNVAAHRQVHVDVLLKTRSLRETLQPQKLKMDVELIATSKTKQQLLALRCVGTLHTSTIVVAQPSINFGDTQVGHSKKASVVIENKSPLPGCAIVQLRSKIISLGEKRHSEREQLELVELGGFSSRSIELVILPQRVNPTYRKQLTVVNKFNPEERFIVNIEANNMAPKETKLHDELYVWDSLLPAETQLRAISGSPLIVPYLCRSKSTTPIVLTVSTTSPEIDTFTLDLAVDREKLSRSLSLLQTVFQQSDDVACESVVSAREELNQLLSAAQAVENLVLQPQQEVTVYARILRTATNINDFLSKEDGISVKVDGLELPRFVRLSYRLCSTHFEVAGQRTKNFGDVNIGDRKQTKLSVVNKCKSTLFFMITKSRSVTASHIRIGKPDNDKQSYFGVVRPFATRDVEITFLPGIKGSFDEKLRVTNVIDISNDITVAVKAQVTKVDTFDVTPESWSFGEVSLGEEGCRVGAKLCVSNTSKTKREFRLKLEGPSQDRFFRFDGVDVRLQLEMEHVGSGSGSTRKIEEQIEKLEQKLKIYVRKLKTEKIESARKRIEVLRRALLGEEVEIDQDVDLSSSEDEGGGRGRSRLSHSEFLSLAARDGIALPTLGPSESVSLTLALNCQRLGKEIPAIQSSSINVMVFEAKDQEINKIIPVDLTLLSSQIGGSRSAETHDTQLPVLQVSTLTPFFFLEAALVPLHNTLLNDPAPFKISLTSSHETTFVLLEPFRCGGPSQGALDARFKFSPRNGTVKLGETQWINVECIPRCVGPQRYIVPVKNIRNPQDVKHFCVELNPVVDEDLLELDPKVIDFQHIITPCDSHSYPARTIVVRNRTTAPCTIVARSNRPTQILLYRDVSCSQMFNNPGKIAPKGLLRLYAKFLPSSKCNFQKARKFCGGVLVESIEGCNDSCSVNFSSFVRVQAVVGAGDLAVSGSRTIDLGIVGGSERGVNTSICVRNLSDTFSIPFTCAASSNVVPDKDGYVAHPGEEVKVSLFVKTMSPGLIQESVIIVNKACCQEPQRVTLTAFKPDGAISMAKSEIHFPLVAIERHSDGCFHLLAATKCYCSSVFHNHSSKDIILVAKSSLPISLGDPDSSERCAGGRVRVDAKHQQGVEWFLTETPTLTQEDCSKLLAHEMVTLTSTAFVEVGQVIDENRHALFRMARNIPQIGQCVLMPKVSVKLAMSEGRVSPQEIDVGTIGKTQELSFLLTNLSKVLPLRLKVECEPTVRLPQNHVIEPSTEAEVRGVLDVDLIRNQGVFRFEVCFVNEMNGENDITAIVCGRFYRRLFHLAAEAQADELLKNITLPAINLDPTTQAGAVSEAKVILTCSEQNITLQPLLVEADAFRGAVNVQILNYDATDVAENITFVGKPHHLRVRCTVSDGNLPRLMNAFFGARPKQLSSIGFDDIGEVEKWKGMPSSLKWLGRIHFANSLTTDEEMDIFSTVNAVATVVVDSPKVILKRSTVDVKRSTYHGKVVVTNPCSTHIATIVVIPTVSPKCSTVVTLCCSSQKETIEPGREVVITVTVTADAGTEANIEQGMALVIADETVAFSGVAVRFGVGNVETDVDIDDDDASRGSESLQRTESFECGSLELKNCTPVAGIEGSYTLSTSVAKHAELSQDVRIVNMSIMAPLEYTCHVVSQSPQPWIQSVSQSGRLKPQESHSLRLSVNSSEVGTYFAFIVISNIQNPSEMLCLKITCDVFVSAGEGFFDILTPSAQRLLSHSQPVPVHLGTIVGEGSIRKPFFDIVNKVTEPLEFQLNAMKPRIRMQRRGSDEWVPLDTCNVGELRISLCIPQERVAQTYIVVDGRSRQRVMMMASFDQIQPIPLETLCSVEVEVAVKCKVVRDIHYIIKAHFELLSKGLTVEPTKIYLKHDASIQTFPILLRNPTASPQTYVVHYESGLLTLEPESVAEVMAYETKQVTVTFCACKFPTVLQRDDRGVEAHLFVYRLGEPRERYLVTLSTGNSIGKPSRPVASTGQEHERLLLGFVRRFSTFMTRFGPQIEAIGNGGGDADEEVLKLHSMEHPATFETDEVRLILHLVTDAIWLCDEIMYFTTLLRNSRTFAALSRFLSTIVLSHPTVDSIRRRRSSSREPALLAVYGLIETAELLDPTAVPLAGIQGAQQVQSTPIAPSS